MPGLRSVLATMSFTVVAAALIASCSSADTDSSVASPSTTLAVSTTTGISTTAFRPDAPAEPLRSDVAIVNHRARDVVPGALSPWVDGVGYVRVWGGSRGMATYPTVDAVPGVLRSPGNENRWDVVAPSEIDGLVGMQVDHGVRIIYMVNVNDTLASQVGFITHLLGEGVDVAMLELGNELYLSKFRDGDTTKLGVARSWNAQQYVELLDEWGPEFRERFPGVPLYGVGASHGSGDNPRDLERRAWNATMLDALDDTPELIDGITFHHYAGQERNGVPHEEAISNEGFAYLDTFGALPIAITESGYVLSELDEAGLALAEEFWSAFRSALKDTDTFGVHVLYDPSGRAASFGLYDDDGRSPVGDRFSAWLATWAATP